MATTHFKRNSFFSEEPGTTTISIDELNGINSIYARLDELEEKVIQSKQMTLLKDVVSQSSVIGTKLKTPAGVKDFITHLENEEFGNDKEGQEGIEYNSIYLVDIPGSLHGEKYELVYLKPGASDENQKGKWTLLGSTSLSDEEIEKIKLDLYDSIADERNRAIQVETDLANSKANKTDVANEFQRVDGDISELSGCIDHITDDFQTKEDAKKELSTVIVDGKEYNGGLIFDQTQFFKTEMVPETDDSLPLPVSISIKPDAFDEYGAANKALSAAEVYTDSQIDAVVDSLSDYCTVSEASTLSTDLADQIDLLNSNFTLERNRSQLADAKHTDDIEYLSSVVETKENAAIVSAEVLLSAKTYVDGQIDAIVNGAPEIFDTLKELADQLSSIDGTQGLIVDVSHLKAWVQNDKDFTAQDIINDLDDAKSKQIKKIESIEDLTDIQGIGFGNDILTYAEPYVINGFVPNSAIPGKLEGTIYGVCKDVEYSILTGSTLESEPEEYCSFISDSDYKITVRIDMPDDNPAFFKVAKKDETDKRFSVLFDVHKDTRVNSNSENLVTNKAIATEFKKYVPLTGGHMSGKLSITDAPRLDKEKAKTTYASNYIDREYTNLSAGIESQVQFNYPTDEGHFELSSGESYGEAERTFATREWATEKFRTQEQCLEEFVTIEDNSALSAAVENDHTLLEEIASVASVVSNDIVPELQTKAEAEEQLSTIALNGSLVTGGLFLNENQFHVSEFGTALSIEIDETDFEEDIRIAAETALNAAKSYTDEKIGEVNTAIENNYSTINGKLNTVNDQLDALMTAIDGKATSLEVAELSEKLDSKADLSAVYTKAEADALFLTKQDVLSEVQLSAVNSGVNADWKLSVDDAIAQIQISPDPALLENYVSKQELKDQLSSDLSGLAEFNYADPTEMTLSVLIHNVGILQNTFTNLIQSL